MLVRHTQRIMYCFCMACHASAITHPSYGCQSPSKWRQVKDVSDKEHKKARPDGLNTVNMLKVASSSLNIGPAHAMQVPHPPPPPGARARAQDAHECLPTWNCKPVLDNAKLLHARI